MLAPPPTETTYQLEQWLVERVVAGIIGRFDNNRIANQVRRLKIPCVNIYLASEKPVLPVVYFDNLAAGRMAAEHLLERKFRYFGFCHRLGMYPSVQRREGFTERLREEGLECSVYDMPLYPSDPNSWIQWQVRMADWLYAIPKPAGIMACNDGYAQLILEAAKRSNVKIPDELAVIGADNDAPLCQISSPPLTSVPIDWQRLGYEAAGLLDRLMAGEPAPEKPFLLSPPSVVPRHSTDVLAIDDREVVTALRYISAHAIEGIGIEDVLRQVPLSRSVLQRRFRKAMGHTIMDEIQDAKIRHAARLLTETDTPMNVIAFTSGFRHQQYMNAVFRRRLKKTPGQLRSEAKKGIAKPPK
jgi:LacI family transcriptional regulator